MERILDENDFIVSKTDKSGRITYCNRVFMQLAEYEEEELIGKPHNFIRHEKMPRAVFKLLWERIENKEEVFAFVINKSKRNNYYWVYANVTASLDKSGNIIGYYSVRRKPNSEAVKVIEGLYTDMVRIEKNEGLEASMKFLTNLLDEKELSYDEFIINLQG